MPIKVTYEPSQTPLVFVRTGVMKNGRLKLANLIVGYIQTS